MTRKQVNFRLPQEKVEALQAKADEEGKKINTVLERLVDDYLADDSKKLAGGGISQKKIEEMINSAIESKTQQIENSLAPLMERIEHLEKSYEKLASDSNQLESANGNGDSNKLASASTQEEAKEESIIADSPASSDTAAVTDGYNQDTGETKQSHHAIASDTEHQESVKKRDGESPTLNQNSGQFTNAEDNGEETQSAIEPLTQSALGKRLGCSGEAIRQRRNKEGFKDWVKSKDPDGMVWEYRKDKKYHPVP